MPSFSKIVLSLALLNAVMALPTPQLAGEGSFFDSVFTDTDSGVGYGIKDAEEKLAGNVAELNGNNDPAGTGNAAPAPAPGPASGPPPPPPARRQLAGEGSFFDSVFTDTDSGVGYAVKDAEENLAKNIAGAGGAGGAGNAGGAPPPPPARRQLNKVANGFQILSEAAGTGKSTEGLTDALDTVDGDSTNAAADLGASIGNTELGTFEGIGSSVPKTRRQLNKVANGFQILSEAAGTGKDTEGLTDALDTVDGDSTNAAANLGATIGNTELGTLEGIGSSVPKL